MHLRLNREIINETKITKPFEIIELGVSRKNSDNTNLPCIRLYFSDDREELENLDFKNADHRPLRCIEFKPQGKFAYMQVQQAVKSNYMYCRVITENCGHFRAYGGCIL